MGLYWINVLPSVPYYVIYDINVMLGNVIQDCFVELPMPTVTYYLQADDDIVMK